MRAGPVFRRYIATALVALAVGLLGASPARATPTILRINMSATDTDYADPALSYFTPMWQIEYATCANLVSYPDAEGQAGATIVPELATSMPSVSADGLT